jgi:F0F1-type ATP synthase assembly protein I
MKEGDERSEIFRRAGPYLGLGTMFAASIGLGIGAGYWADGRFGTRPWLTLAGALLGLVVGFYNFFVVVTRRPPD